MTTTENPSNETFDLVDYANDPERIGEISMWNPDVSSLIHAVEDNCDAIFTWGYDKGERKPLDKLYEKAKTSQWNGQTDLDWSIEVDPEALASAGARDPLEVSYFADNPESPIRNFNEKEWSQLGMESFNWSLSQFMHGEQGALLCTAKIVESVPWIDAKYYAATQVVDEARHVEVFAQYLDSKLGGIGYPVNHHLGLLLDDILNDSRWDITYLGMQIMVEGLALAAFGFMHQTTEEPLLKKLLRYVMSDEARHVAFGVLSLKEVYEDMTQAELRERQEFAFEAALRMRDRFMRQEVWHRMGVDTEEMVKFQLAMPDELRVFQRMLFSKIVPNCKKLGLLDAGDGWLRDRFTDIGVIQFEDWVDTSEEFLELDEVAKDREAQEAS
ncbi:MAG: ferritin-like domain-containing protein [Acidimicrobiales bacterium]|tara:strand:+ start:252 stop:1406 length:1155 start_codon:yes stop_codon:yes gene_type:complete